LSPTEARVLELFDQGMELKEIAALLDCSPHTVATYARRICQKFCCYSLRRAAWLSRQAADYAASLPPLE
jgi:DNA-binding NarL/FixJ family response regulator